MGGSGRVYKNLPSFVSCRSQAPLLHVSALGETHFSCEAHAYSSAKTPLFPNFTTLPIIRIDVDQTESEEEILHMRYHTVSSNMATFPSVL